MKKNQDDFENIKENSLLRKLIHEQLVYTKLALKIAGIYFVVSLFLGVDIIKSFVMAAIYYGITSIILAK